MTKTLAAMAFLVLAAGSAMAAEHDFVVTNSTQGDLIAVHVQGGKVNDFKPVASNGERAFTLTLPDGVCVTQLQFVFADIEALAMPGYDACNSGGIDLGH